MLRLVWAVDPFGDPSMLAAAARSAAALGRLGPVEVIPVFALPPWIRPIRPSDSLKAHSAALNSLANSGNAGAVFAGPVWPGGPGFSGLPGLGGLGDDGVVKRILGEARAQFGHVLSRLKGELARTLTVRMIPGRTNSARTASGGSRARVARRGLYFRPLEILVPSSESAPEGAGLSFQADEISAFALERGAASVLVCTHARRRPGAPRARLTERLAEWAIGSFAETLIERSRVPVIALQPVEPPARTPLVVKEMLFATDFSRESQLAFGPALGFARKLGLPLVLYHCLEPPTPILDYAYSPYLVYASERRQERAHLQATAWLARAAGAGVRARAHFEEGEVSVAESVAQAARVRSSLIALAARSNPAVSALLGSVTRKLVRLATSPLWVLHVDRRSARDLSRDPTRDLADERDKAA